MTAHRDTPVLEGGSLDQLIDTAHGDVVCQTIRASCGTDQTIAFVSGNFNVVHPGHLRLLKFAAEQANILVVGVNPDSTPGVTLAQELRLDNVRSISFVHHVVRLEGSASDFIARLRPSVVVKGKEFEDRSNPEQDVVDAYGGRLIFSSGELRFASLSLLERDANVDISTVRKPLEFPTRHGFEISGLKKLLGKLSGMRVAVIGDLIVDEYVTCDAVGMSQEDPTIVVTPLMTRTFVGGAGAVAAHAHGLGADVQFFTLVGNDEAATFALETLEQHGVICQHFTDDTRPTTRKQRFRALNKTLLRVNHLRQHAADVDIQRRMLSAVERALKSCDLLLFSCFNYGCLPQDLVDAVADRARSKDVMMAADSQVSSQTGDVSRFKGMALLTPTEREARVALNDFVSGLAVVSDRLSQRARARNLVITLGGEGVLVNTIVDGELNYDRLPAFNPSPKDVSGAGDSFFMASSMALRAGGDIWQASYLGSLAAALQVSRVGNLPLTTAELMTEIDETGFSHE
jgi:rfaE bifunctional protein kinase chain/domain